MKKFFGKRTGNNLFRYYKSHIWIEILTSVVLITVILLGIFYVFLRNQYYDNVIRETETSGAAVLSTASASLSNILSEQLRIGGEIAVNSTIYDIVHRADLNGGLSLADELDLKRQLSIISVYSDDIASIAVVTKNGLLCEYARFWGYGTMPLWTESNQDLLMKMYDDVMNCLLPRQPGYYVVGTDPVLRTSMPVMPVFHVGFPLLGTTRSLKRVDAAIVITYNMNSIASSSAIVSDTGLDYTYRYLADSDGKIIFHEDAEYIGTAEEEYLRGTELEVASRPVPPFGWRVCLAIEKQQIHESVRRMYVRSSLVYVAVIVLVFSAWQMFLRSVLKPVDIIKKNMEAVEHGQRKKIDIRGEHELWLLAAEYNEMLDALSEQQEMVRKEYREKMEMSELRNQAERIALESQINAHFIFNTLNAINYNAIETGSTETSRLLKRLSNILQYTLSAQSEATLGTEFDMVNEYLYLQKYRLMDKFEYTIDFPLEYSEWPCCKLFLQPFVENSIVHGFENTESGGKIWIRGEAEENRFRVEIGDNGCGMSAELCEELLSGMEEGPGLSLSGQGIAVKNVLKRQRMFFGKAFEATLRSTPGSGTVFVFYLPIPENTEVK